MEKELISIVVPCYNVEKFVEKCLDSIKNQSYTNIEVIIIDDGSKDRTSEIVKNFVVKDNRFHYFYKENGGLGDARNYGIKKINGNYVCFIDSDDSIDEKYIEKLYNTLIKNNADISVCNYYLDYGKHLKEVHIENYMLECLMTPNAWNKLYKSSLFANVEYTVGKWYEDLLPFSKFIFSGVKPAIINEPLYYYFQNENSIIHTASNKIFQIYDIMNEIENYAKANNYYDKFYDTIVFANIYHILIGLMYRASKVEKFDKKMLKDIYKYVNDKYPRWYKNSKIKKCFDTKQRIYLFCLKHKYFNIIMFFLKKESSR